MRYWYYKAPVLGFINQKNYKTSQKFDLTNSESFTGFFGWMKMLVLYDTK